MSWWKVKCGEGGGKEGVVVVIKGVGLVMVLGELMVEGGSGLC